MKTLKQVTITPVFVTYVPETSLMEEGKVYISKEYKTASHLCLCGCGLLTVTPLMPGEFDMKDAGGKVSFTPSIFNRQYPCQSHYIITNNVANFVR